MTYSGNPQFIPIKRIERTSLYIGEDRPHPTYTMPGSPQLVNKSVWSRSKQFIINQLSPQKDYHEIHLKESFPKQLRTNFQAVNEHLEKSNAWLAENDIREPLIEPIKEILKQYPIPEDDRQVIKEEKETAYLHETTHLLQEQKYQLVTIGADLGYIFVYKSNLLSEKEKKKITQFSSTYRTYAELGAYIGEQNPQKPQGNISINNYALRILGFMGTYSQSTPDTLKFEEHYNKILSEGYLIPNFSDIENEDTYFPYNFALLMMLTKKPNLITSVRDRSYPNRKWRNNAH